VRVRSQGPAPGTAVRGDRRANPRMAAPHTLSVPLGGCNLRTHPAPVSARRHSPYTLPLPRPRDRAPLCQCRYGRREGDRYTFAAKSCRVCHEVTL
jgi:hypothetical protein